MDAHFYLGRQHEASAPQVRVVVFEQGDDTLRDRVAPRLLQPHKKKSVVGSRCVSPHIGEVEILRYQKPSAFLRAAPYIRIRLAGQSFPRDRVHVVPESIECSHQANGNILV